MPSNQEDEGFEALLKPIQDLTRNWEMDLSLHLEDYLNYIRQICGDNIPDMNFAQAAVLVQNSANIYCKKVDFLFNSVMELLQTVNKKQNAAKSNQSQEEDGSGGVQPSGKRRKAVAVLDIDEFNSIDAICSDRNLTLNLEREKLKANEKNKKKIVLNAAIKVKAKEKTSCNVYHCGLDVMGKKEEFRLHWRICSAGTIHEEFVIKKSRFKAMDPVEISVIANNTGPADESLHDYDDHFSHHNAEGDQPPPEEQHSPPPLVTSLFSNIPIDRESENRFQEARLRKEAVNTVDVGEIEWQPNDFNDNIPDKPIKKRKVLKIPPGVDDEKKRKNIEGDLLSSLSFTITDVLFDQYKNSSFARDQDFCYQSKAAAKYKRQLLLQHRAKYQAYMEDEVGKQVDDFPGFYNEDNDSDNENDFEGFGDVHDNDIGGAADAEVPLPDKENILVLQTNECNGYDGNTYDNEAMKTLQAYRTRKIDHGRMTDMARRVEEWHQRILPKLEAAEERSSFDIHAYGSKVLDAFSEEIGCIKSFAEIVAGQPREEVARYFLATLVLANQYNIEISETQPGDLNVDCVQLKLLSVVRHHEELDDNLRQTSDK